MQRFFWKALLQTTAQSIVRLVAEWEYVIPISNSHNGISCTFLCIQHDALYHTFVGNVNIIYEIKTIISTIINAINENFINYHIFMTTQQNVSLIC